MFARPSKGCLDKVKEARGLRLSQVSACAIMDQFGFGEPIDFRTDAADDVGELRRANLVRTTRCPRQLLKSTMLCEVSGRWSEFPAGERAMCLRRPG